MTGKRALLLDWHWTFESPFQVQHNTSRILLSLSLGLGWTQANWQLLRPLSSRFAVADLALNPCSCTLFGCYSTQATMPAPDILGDRQSGQDVRTQNGFSLFPSSVSLILPTCFIDVFVLHFSCMGSGSMSSGCQHCEIVAGPRWSWQGLIPFIFAVIGVPWISFSLKFVW